MNKTLYIFFSLFVLSVFAFDDVPILPQDSGIDIKYVDYQNSLINYDKMKKSTKIKAAQDEAMKNKAPRLEFDTRQIIHQRTLDYTTRQNNSTVLPRF